MQKGQTFKRGESIKMTKVPQHAIQGEDGLSEQTRQNATSTTVKNVQFGRKYTKKQNHDRGISIILADYVHTFKNLIGSFYCRFETHRNE